MIEGKWKHKNYRLLPISVLPSDTALSQQDHAASAVRPMAYSPPQGSQVTAYPS